MVIMLYQKQHAKDGFNGSEIMILMWEMKNVEDHKKKKLEDEDQKGAVYHELF